MARQIGFGTADQARISLAASELARLLVWQIGAQPGEIILSPTNKNGHPGMQVACLLSFEQISGDNEAAELPRSGAGLEGARQLVDESFIEPQGDKYARVTLMKWLIQGK
jgi:anti-sigma regulatory factor (Ser/Thr protein kinase)